MCKEIITSMQMTLNFFYLLQLLLILIILLSHKLQFQEFLTGCLPIFSLSILPKLSFSSLVFLNNSLNSALILFVYQTMSLSHLLTARNLGVILHKNLSYTQHISSASKSCFVNIRDLQRTRNMIDQTTAATIAILLSHSLYN